MPPRRRQLAGKLLDRIVDTVSDEVFLELDRASPRTMQLDGWDKDVEQLINFILSCADVEEYLGDYNATGKTKDAEFTADLVIKALKLAEARYKPESPDEVIVDAVCTDNPSVNQVMRRIVSDKWPKRLFLYSCWLHGLSKLIEDIFNLDFFQVVSPITQALGEEDSQETVAT